MAVVRIGEVGMGVGQRLMSMPVGMLGAGCDRDIVGMMVMGVVRVFMCVFQHLVRVLVLVALAQVQPDAEQHQQSGSEQRQGQGIPHRDGQ